MRRPRGRTGQLMATVKRNTRKLIAMAIPRYGVARNLAASSLALLAIVRASRPAAAQFACGQFGSAGGVVAASST